MKTVDRKQLHVHVVCLIFATLLAQKLFGLLFKDHEKSYEGPAKSFVTGFGLLQCYVLSNIFFITNLQSIPPLLKHIFVTFLPSREKQINSFLLVSVEDTDK